ncbi:MAG: TonB family protein [Nitrospira sp.]|nr:TonB family protein [Nitrospira sp.]MDH5336813.1 TonB family protein [Nitrospira sp.]
MTRSGSQTGPLAASWLVSCLLHGGLAVAAISFVQRMQLAPQADPFQWDVAMVAPLSSLPGATSRSGAMAPPSPALQQQAPPAGKQVQERTRPVTPPAPVPIVEISPELHQEQAPPDSVPSVPSPQVARQDLSGPSADLVMSAQERLTVLPESQVAKDSPVDSSSTMIVSSAPPNQLTPTKADYGWLTELMARWIEDLNKRYPATLRTEGVQGKVTLTAMLHEDGLLSDVRVAKSSGNPALDQVALEDVRSGPPITLSRPLERHQMPVKFSISYDLKMAR